MGEGTVVLGEGCSDWLVGSSAGIVGDGVSIGVGSAVGEGTEVNGEGCTDEAPPQAISATRTMEAHKIHHRDIVQYYQTRLVGVGSNAACNSGSSPVNILTSHISLRAGLKTLVLPLEKGAIERGLLNPS